jgi:hypothetical protein
MNEVDMRKLFSKERALYLVDNPTKVGFSWWFFFAGIATGYWVHKHFGDSRFIIMVVEKYGLMVASLFFFFLRRLVEKNVKSGRIRKDSTLIYCILPGGYVFTFLGALWFTHMFFGFSVL